MKTWILLAGLFLSVAANAQAQAHDTDNAQQILETESREWKDDKDTNTYIEGIPAISYNGEKCAQTEAAKIIGHKSVSINCYFTQEGDERQCTFDWDDIGWVASITVQSYKESKDGDKTISVQSNSTVARKAFVTWKNVAKTASNMINQYCGADLKSAAFTTHTEQPIAPLKNGIPCDLEYQWDHGKAADREIYCHKIQGKKTLQCHVEDNDLIGLIFFSGLTREVTNYNHFSTAKDNSATTQKEAKSSPTFHFMHPNDEQFKRYAYDWLNKNCN